MYFKENEWIIDESKVYLSDFTFKSSDELVAKVENNGIIGLLN